MRLSNFINFLGRPALKNHILDETRGDEMGASGHQYTEKAEIVGFTQFYSLYPIDKNAEVL